jgi:mannose-1-phosphate guanylyltransferase / mannose-6-phosphate isomerase
MTDMSIQPVILAGGSGTRLWPTSRRDHPKQLLSLAGSHSLLQATALRLNGLAGSEEVDEPIVVTNEEYRFIVAEQLREIGIANPRVILEPVGRNTAPAMTLAALLAPQEEDPILLVMPSDQLVKDRAAFQAAVAEAVAQARGGAFVTFGIVPDHPETGYGYIQAGAPVPGAATARSLEGFVEKPDEHTARTLIAGGHHLWNSGIVMVRRSVWLDALRFFRPDIGEACRNAVAAMKAEGPFLRPNGDEFAACPSDSIDYAVLEKLRTEYEDAGAVTIPLDAGWSDVGAWDALWAVTDKDAEGNVVRGRALLEDTHDSLVFSESGLVALLGCNDLVVVDTGDATLVAPKARTKDLKRLVARVQETDEALTRTPRRVNRPWGTYETVEEGDRFKVKHIVVRPGASLSLQLHHRRAEHWVVVKGQGEVTCGDRVDLLGVDESAYIPCGAPHRLRNPGVEPLEIIEVQSGDYLGEDDIVRLDDQYGRTR